MKHPDFRIVFFGTPEFAACSLEAIINAGYHVVAVVTAPDKPAGRGKKLKKPEVKVVAEKLSLPLLQPTNLKDPEFQHRLKNLNATLGIVIAFRMLPEAVWSMPKLGTFNLHASLLPQYRGAAPINHAIINGETVTGLTTFFLKHEIDTGNIVLQKEIEILESDNAGILHDRLKIHGADLVLDTLKLVVSGNWPETPQHSAVPLKSAPKLNREFCEITSNLSAIEAHNKVRGLAPVPGSWISTEFGKIKLFKTKVSDISIIDAQKLYFHDKKVYFPCSDFYLELVELQPEGKSRMDSLDFLNGLANRF